MFEIDNRNGTEIIYFIVDIAAFHGEVNVGQISNSTFDFVEYTDKDEWMSDLELLGIEHTEE